MRVGLKAIRSRGKPGSFAGRGPSREGLETLPGFPCQFAVVCILAGCAPALVWEGKTPDRRQWIRVVEDRQGQRVSVGDRVGRSYGGIGIEALTTSKDGRHVAYPALTGTQWTTVLDEREVGRWSGIGELGFSPDGSALAFSAERDRRWFVVVDGKPGPAFDDVLAGTMQWSEEGRAFAYVARRAGRTHVVFNQACGPGFDGVSRLLVGRTGTRLAYLGRRGEAWSVVDDGTIGPAQESIVELAMSPNERHLAHVWRTGEAEGLVLDGNTTAPYHQGHVSSLFVGDDGGLTFVARSGRMARVVHRDRVEPAYDKIEKLAVTGAGHVAYVGWQGEKPEAVIDGSTRIGADAIEEVVPSPDGRQFLVVARRGGRWILVRGDVESRFDRVVADSAAFSRDGKHWGVLAGDAKSRDIFISVDGETRRPFDVRELVLLREKHPGMSPRQAQRELQRLVAAELEIP
jgi:hypothetical protein